jgi:gas vesicle protein
MGASTDQLKRDIEYTRADMSNTVDAIEDRIRPGRAIQRQKNRMSEKWCDVRDRVMGRASDLQDSVGDTAGDVTDTIKDAPDAMMRQTQGAPMVAGAMALGLGFLMAVAFPATDTERRVSSRLAEKVEPAKQEMIESAKDVADHLKEPAKQAANEVKDAAREGAADVSDTAKHAVQDTKQQASDSAAAVQAARSETTA